MFFMNLDRAREEIDGPWIAVLIGQLCRPPHTEALRVNYVDYVRAVRPTVCDFARSSVES